MNLFDTARAIEMLRVYNRYMLLVPHLLQGIRGLHRTGNAGAFFLGFLWSYWLQPNFWAIIACNIIALCFMFGAYNRFRKVLGDFIATTDKIKEIETSD